jgi:hypothetical protein
MFHIPSFFFFLSFFQENGEGLRRPFEWVLLWFCIIAKVPASMRDLDCSLLGYDTKQFDG